MIEGISSNGDYQTQVEEIKTCSIICENSLALLSKFENEHTLYSNQSILWKMP